MIESGPQAPERVLGAAVQYNGEIFRGITHAHAFEQLREQLHVTNPELTEGTDGDIKLFITRLQAANPDLVLDGFATSVGRFVSRAEALQIAEQAEQVRNDATPNGELHSEDLAA
ncbi:MAG: hypothetical protein KC877_00560 [Candidatus Kaiserbacteria bacterium]|nr:hypothetical protein [Candidatus Kaiserbacteria bacterium]MCB9816550.1 hypothetical protein [Candidatus Nomurabacteria bacterium]